MSSSSYKQENLVQIAEFFRDSDGQPIPTLVITNHFGLPKDPRLAILRLLQRRKYILKMGSSASKSGVHYQRNPDFQGVFADVLVNYAGKKYVNSHEVAGRAYVPPPNKEPWEPLYIKELLKHKKLCESTR
jgi:hypothetical protein